MKKRICAAILLASMLLGVQASAWDNPGIHMSAWAVNEVQSAYDNGAVSANFNLGTDYTRPITRGELARLTVDLIAHEQQLTIDDLVAQFGITLQAVPLTPAQPEGEEQTESGSKIETSGSTDSTVPSDGVDPSKPDDDTPIDDTTSVDADDSTPNLGTEPSQTDGDTPVSNTASSDADDNTHTDSAEKPDATANGNTSDTGTAPSEPDGAGVNGNPGTSAPDSTTPDNDTDTPSDTEQPTDNEGNAEPETDTPVDGTDGETAPPTDEPKPELPAWGDPLDGGLPFVQSGSFSDTQSVYVELAARLGIVNGADGLFRPNDPVTRAEAAAMMQRCMGVLGFTEANQQPMQFTDNYAIPRWAVESVKYISGRTDTSGQAIMGGANGKFSPQDPYTIEQAILSLLRMQSSLAVTDIAEGWRDAPDYNSVTLSLTFGGDCTLGRGHNFAYSGSLDEMYDRKGPSYFFSGIPEFFNDDLTMVNFEGTLTNSTSYANKTFAFKGRPAYAQILDKGSIDVVTVANNHSMDYLQRGFDDTIRYLSPYVAVSGYERMPIVTVKDVRIGFASNVGWSYDAAQRTFITNAIKNLRARGAELIVFNYHWGVERAYRSNSTQRAIAHYCIDQGADLVIGHHPHVVQEVETYKGKQIAYSLGNLVFGGNNNPSDKNCLIFRQNYTFDLDTRKVTSASYKALPYKVSSVSWRNDYHPVKA